MTGQPITLRLRIQDPVPGVAYSLQDKKNHPVEPVTASDVSLALDVSVRLAPGPRFLGEFVRSEGPSRRFVYIAIGTSAGQHGSPWTRRAKIDIHTIPEGLLAKALEGAVLEVLLPGRARDGGPACATVVPLEGWRVVG
ncbi:DUF5990 family protein [Caulobacter radicis]|uniref:Uncharacterized protein n=1 Tax=Caulobacter radicis TaxID=2172650 RepID=A0A2T9J5W6_9CAUL|nr:DUF5990 family protein [Caulobacter radicis]PVM76362.1 hypothetical protein DDF65_17720 [Caulobacter radicis]